MSCPVCRLRVAVADLDNDGGTKVAARCGHRFLCQLGAIDLSARAEEGFENGVFL